MRKTARFTFTALTCLFLITLFVSAQVHPVVYSNKSLQGPYSFLENKWLSDYNDNATGSIGIMTFDGSGNLTLSMTMNTANTVTTYTGTGTYSVAKEGSGSMSFTLSGGLNFTETMVLDSSGKGFQFVQTSCNGCGDTTDVSTGTAVAMGASSFTNASLKGNYEWLTAKWASEGGPNAEVELGTMIFDGKGNVKGSSTDDYAGTVSSLTFTGTYTVNSDGSGSMTLTANGTYITTDAFVINTASSTGLGAKGLQLLNTYTPGTSGVRCGTATKQ
jgi:hypothetical protein